MVTSGPKVGPGGLVGVEVQIVLLVHRCFRAFAIAERSIAANAAVSTSRSSGGRSRGIRIETGEVFIELPFLGRDECSYSSSTARGSLNSPIRTRPNTPAGHLSDILVVMPDEKLTEVEFSPAEPADIKALAAELGSVRGRGLARVDSREGNLKRALHLPILDGFVARSPWQAWDRGKALTQLLRVAGTHVEPSYAVSDLYGLAIDPYSTTSATSRADMLDRAVRSLSVFRGESNAIRDSKAKQRLISELRIRIAEVIVMLPQQGYLPSANVDSGYPLSLPRSDEVRSEIILLSKGMGITYSRVRHLAGRTSSLPIVSNELRRLRLVDEDRLVATFKVIDCGTRSWLPNPRHVLVIRTLLNFRNDDLTYEARQELLSRDLAVPVAEVTDIAELASSQIASTLVSSQRSPCAGPVDRLSDRSIFDDQFLVALKSWSIYDILITIARKDGDEFRTSRLWYELSVQLGSEAKSAFITYLRDLRWEESAAHALVHDDLPTFGQTLIERVIVERYERRLRRLVRSNGEFFGAERLLHVFAPRVNYFDYALALAVELDLVESEPKYVDSRLGIPTALFFDALHASVRVLANLIFGIAFDEGWHAFLGVARPSNPDDKHKGAFGTP